MSKRRSTGRRPVEDYATDRVDFEQLNVQLYVALAYQRGSFGKILRQLLRGGHDEGIDEILLEYAETHGPDAEQPALDLFDTGLFVDELHELVTRVSSALNLDPADLDRLIRNVEWLNLPGSQKERPFDSGHLLRCSFHGWVLDPDFLNFRVVRVRDCFQCPCPITPRGTGRPAKYCSTYCRVAAHRARKRGERDPQIVTPIREMGRADDPVPLPPEHRTSIRSVVRAEPSRANC
ncbi:hypothetical protein [Nocardia sp. NPDC005825]|uniref:hypothetical protein n=1 Tax=unclassified Nocardia TaxID=2637762 RepID=UPI0033F4005E